MLLSRLLLLAATMTVQGNGQHMDNKQRNLLLREHVRQLDGKRMEQLQRELKNSTRRRQKLEAYIQAILRPEVQQVQYSLIQKHMVPLLELSTSLLNQTRAQTIELTDMEAQVLSQLSHMGNKMMEALQTTSNLEQQLQKQSHEPHLLHGHSRDAAVEVQQRGQLASLHTLKEQLQQLLSLQSGALTRIQHGLRAASNSSSHLQQKQHQLLENLQQLVLLGEQGPGEAVLGFQDCEDIHRSGISVDGIFTIFVPNVKEPKRVFCVMDTDGGAWTVIQRRVDGTENFQRNWQEYKQGFGDLFGEHWLGNELVHQLTSSKTYSLRVEMEDWDGNILSANFEHFHLGSEQQFYRIFLDKPSGVALVQGRPILVNSNFSTRDADHDNCPCECAKTMSGGWWFDACGPSNLNGIYYPAGQHFHKINGIRWHHALSPTYSLRATRMMIRPLIS